MKSLICLFILVLSVQPALAKRTCFAWDTTTGNCIYWKSLMATPSNNEKRASGIWACVANGYDASGSVQYGSWVSGNSRAQAEAQALASCSGVAVGCMIAQCYQQ